MTREPWLSQQSLEFPESLPISQYLNQIRQAFEQHQVIVVAGETGSGKTTQLPKLALAMGRGCVGRIGHTQPRRIAARSVAARLAEELGVHLGSEVGYQIRFSQKVSEESYIKVMTDGILLAELAQDRLLKKYDTLIIDEAHERSLNIDFILGYLKWLLVKRPDLKVIITSATLDHQRFSNHFNHCPIIEVSGRSFPVEICYQPLPLETAQSKDLLQMQGILQAIKSLDHCAKGDLLIFLSGERDIRQCSDFLHQAGLKNTEILPLYSKLSASEQQKIFHSSTQRRIILATNIAETSLTIPNIRYVIDTGLARIKRYSSRSKIQRLPIEPIAKASAKQRAGRCGRTAPGICIRLYDENDFLLREEFTPPEILRSNLANVILQMMALKLGDVEKFPWLDPPEMQYWRDAYQCLEELHAIEKKNQSYHLTYIGRLLAQIPLDPRLARMLITASEKNNLTETLIIVSALSVSDVFLRPLDQRQAADEKHRLFFDPRSDFLTFLNLWLVLQHKQEELSNNQFRKFCGRYFLSYEKFKEWRDLYQELKNLSATLFKTMNEINDEKIDLENFAPSLKKYPENSPQWAMLHQSLLSGLLSHVAQKQEQGNYLAARLRTVKLFPGSAVFKKQPPWLMALEFVETKQVYARTIAVIDPAWVEALAPQLIKKTYSEPYWDQKRGEVMAFEKVLFLGLPIIVKRRIRYASIDPSVSHDIFLKQGLALRQLNTSIEFWQHNEKFLIELEKLEEMTRSRHFVPDEQWLYEFYRSKIPVEIFSQIELEKWWRYLDPAIKNNLFLTEKHLEQVDSADCKQAYPTEFVWQDNRLKISYQFSPGAIDDGVSLMVPLLLLAQLPLAPFDWLVPGLLPEKVHALLKGLPKELRKELMPIADAARTCAQSLFIDAGEDFFISLSNVLKQKFSCLIDAKILQQIVLPDFLKFNFKIIDEGKVLATSRDLLDLKQELLSPAPMENLTKQTILYTTWPAESLPEQRKIQQQQLSLIKYPALEAQEGGVVIVMSDSVFLARQIHHWGVTKLLQLRCKAELAYIVKKLLRPKFRAGNSLKNFHEMTSIENYISRWPDFTDYFCYAVINMTFAEDFWHLRTASDFDLCVQTHQQDLVENAQALLDVVYAMVIQLVRIEQSNAVIDLSDLIFTGFLATVPWEWLERYPFYLTAIAESLERDDLFSKIKPYESAKKRYESVLHDELKGLACPKKLSLIVAHQPTIFFEPLACVRESLLRGYYLLQEFRMSLLAPKFKTVESVSLARLEKLF